MVLVEFCIGKEKLLMLMEVIRFELVACREKLPGSCGLINSFLEA